MKLNVAYPATGQQKCFEVDDEKKLRIFYEKRMAQEVEADVLGEGFAFRSGGGNDKQGFAMKKGVLTNGRVCPLLATSTAPISSTCARCGRSCFWPLALSLPSSTRPTFASCRLARKPSALCSSSLPTPALPPSSAASLRMTNQVQKTFKEPRLIIISDPCVDHHAVAEASYVNVPVISFNNDSPLKMVDIAIPCNNKGDQSIGLMWWFFAREVLILRGKISRSSRFILEDKEIMPDLYFYRDPPGGQEGGNCRCRPAQPEYKDDTVVEGAGVTDFSAPDIKHWVAATLNWQAA